MYSLRRVQDLQNVSCCIGHSLRGTSGLCCAVWDCAGPGKHPRMPENHFYFRPRFLPSSLPPLHPLSSAADPPQTYYIRHCRRLPSKIATPENSPDDASPFLAVRGNVLPTATRLSPRRALAAADSGSLRLCPGTGYCVRGQRALC